MQAESPVLDDYLFRPPLWSHHGEESFGGANQKVFTLAHHPEEHLSLLMIWRV